MPALPALAPLALLALLAARPGTACPIDPAASAAGAALSVAAPGAVVARLRLEDLLALPQQEIEERRPLAPAGAASAAGEQGIGCRGPWLRPVIERGWPEIGTRRDGRWFVIEAIATDGYRAFFSWGELFNTRASDQIVVVLRTDGEPLDRRTGPLALRALSDLRPGPRHVRHLCGVAVRAP